MFTLFLSLPFPLYLRFTPVFTGVSTLEDLTPIGAQLNSICWFISPTGLSPPSSVKGTQSCPTLCNPWTVQSMEFSRPEYWSGSPFPSPGDPPNLGIKPRSPILWVDSLPVEPQGKPMSQ